MGTAPLTPKGPRFYREFVMDSSEGERLVSAMTLWILVDPVTRRILRPASFPYPIDFQEPGLKGIIGDIPLPKGMETGPPTLTIPVRYSHIDVNGHVNNTFYGDFTMDALPAELATGHSLDTVVISFQNEARLGEAVEIASTVLPGGETYIKGLHGGTACFEAMVSLRN